MLESHSQVRSVQYLRALAAISVVFFHVSENIRILDSRLSFRCRYILRDQRLHHVGYHTRKIDEPAGVHGAKNIENECQFTGSLRS